MQMAGIFSVQHIGICGKSANPAPRSFRVVKSAASDKLAALHSSQLENVGSMASKKQNIYVSDKL